MSIVSTVLFRLLLLGVVACLAPLLIYITRAHILPVVVLEIVGGIIIGPQVLHWVYADPILRYLSLMGLSYLLFLSGLEVDLERLRGRIMIFVGSGFLLSLGLALLVGFSLFAIVQVTSPLLLAIILVSTSLGIVIPILKDVGESSTDFGQLVIAGATLGEFGSIILLSLFFSSEAASPVAKVALFGIIAALILLVSLPSSTCIVQPGLRIWYSGSRIRLRKLMFASLLRCWSASSPLLTALGLKLSSVPF
jgi:Kef-type K+ transport system membrane component KefB